MSHKIQRLKHKTVLWIWSIFDRVRIRIRPDKKTDLDPGLDKASKSGVIFFYTEISYLVLVLIKPPECFFFLKSHVFSFEKK